MIGATSLRTNNGYYNATPKNFGKAKEKKNNTASGIAQGVGAAAMTAVGAYFLKGKLANLNFLKPLKGLATGFIQKLKDVKVLETVKNIWNSAKTFVTDKLSKLNFSGIVDKAKDICSTVLEKAGKVFDFFKKNAPKPHA